MSLPLASRRIVQFVRNHGRMVMLALGVLLTGVFVSLPLVSCRPSGEAVQAKASAPVAQTSESCRECHAEAHAAWSGTDHALANRPISPHEDRAIFTGAPEVADGGTRFALGWDATGPHLRDFTPGSDSARVWRAEMVLGNKPLRQFLMADRGGRWQPTELAWDPAKRDWFNVFGQENRRTGEWGHWTGRGMNWNSMCAQCHMTGYQKNYDEATDSYRSTWIEHGVGCVECHGQQPPEHFRKGYAGSPPPATATALETARQRAMQTCAPCHARGEPLAAGFKPGLAYNDYYRPALPSQPGLYWPDGQQRDEDFNWTSVLLSRMGHAGVTCFDCHDAHTTKTKLPITDNQLCLQCHAAPGRPMTSGITAPAIDPTAHSHHQAGSAGNLCVSCHMPTTNYMQRTPRHDHAWLSPDPLLTKELGIPNACSKCHSDQTLQWNIDAAQKWYGEKLGGRQRARARAVAAAQSGQHDAEDALLNLLRDEDIPAWRATFLDLATPHAAHRPEIATVARADLHHADSLVRAAAVRLLTTLADPADKSALQAAQQDPVRLVRLDAAWAMSAELPTDSAIRREMDEWLRLGIDQPIGRLRLGQDFANRGMMAEAETQMRRAIDWDTHSAPMWIALARVVHAQGRAAEAGALLYRAGEVAPQDASAMHEAGLAYAEAGMLTEAGNCLREAFRRDASDHRAAYNLGLLLAQQNHLQDALAALAQAEKAAPEVADYPYAAATIWLRLGNADEAYSALQRVVCADPNHPEANALLRRWR